MSTGKLNTKDIKTGGGGTPKFLQPGNQSCKITAVALEDFKFIEGGLHIILSMEGKDLGKDFEGFFIDKNDEAKGRYKGQIGSVKAGEWAFADGETTSGIKISRDTEILKFMKNLCIALGITAWLDAQDNKHDTIASLIDAFNKEKPFKDIFIEYCLSGKEYTNKGGYTSYELFLPKYSKTGAPYAKERARVLTFDPEKNIKRKKVEPVNEFGEDAGTGVPAGNSDFDLDK